MVNFGKGEAMKVEIKISGPRGCGKSFLLRALEREIRSVCKIIEDEERREFGEHSDGPASEELIMKVSM